VLSSIRIAPLLILGSLATAPFQCAREPEPDKAIEDDPGEALYKLAEQFEARGDQAARIATLRYLVEHIPSSRFAAQARIDLDAVDAGASDAAP